MRKNLLVGFAFMSFMIGSTITAYATPITVSNDLESIGTDGTLVSAIDFDSNISVSINYTVENPRIAQYGSSGIWRFNGKNGVQNSPLNASNVSGNYFLTGGDNNFNHAEPISFTFNQEVSSFGLTTIDLLENGSTSGMYLNFTAFDSLDNIVDEMSLTGRQGESGLDIDWLVSSSSQNISKVVLLGNVGDAHGFGMDDFFVTYDPGPVAAPVPEPATMLLFGTGLAGLVGTKFRKKVITILT